MAILLKITVHSKKKITFSLVCGRIILMDQAVMHYKFINS